MSVAWLGRADCSLSKGYQLEDFAESFGRYLSRQCDDRHLREWLTRRKAAYFETIGKAWNCGLLNYAATRDAACWQLNRTEAEVWFLLESIESCLASLNTKQMS